MKQLVVLLFTLIFAVPNLTDAAEKSRFGEINEADWKEIQNVITQQITAFEHDDQAAAFSSLPPQLSGGLAPQKFF